MSDEALVAIAQAGSHSAFVELFERHQNTLSRTVQKITRNAHDTEDVLQDCSIKAFIHIKTFNGKSAFSTWLVRIAINTALMTLRKRKPVIAISLDEQANSDHRGAWQIAEPSNDPEQELLEREMQFQIHQAVERLPASLRTVMEAHRFQDRQLKELASMTGLTIAATNSRLYRARLAIRHSVQQMQRESFEVLH
jgi:RNA polymerase sigma-70 factor (ECF subfamily)